MTKQTKKQNTISEIKTEDLGKAKGGTFQFTELRQLAFSAIQPVRAAIPKQVFSATNGKFAPAG